MPNVSCQGYCRSYRSDLLRIKYLLHETDQKLVFAAREITAINENPRATCKEQHRHYPTRPPASKHVLPAQKIDGRAGAVTLRDRDKTQKNGNREPECHDHDNERMDADVTMQSCLAVVVCKIRKQIRLKRIVMVNSLQYLEIGFADFPSQGLRISACRAIVNLAAA